jgi:ABC-type multidrug transport system fused ATPase/permease subunit
VALDYWGDHNLSVVYLLTLFFILMRFLTIVGEFLQTGSTIFSNLKLTNDIVSFSKNVEPESERLESSLQGIETIALKNVSFGHSSNNTIFNNINLTFHRGKSYIIVGKTGGGKSTLLDLIMDFNSPSEGSIYVNDINTKDIDEKSFINKILYVSQEAMVFNNTVKHNLELDKEYPLEKVMYYLGVAELTSTIDNFDGKIDYLLNYRGTNISGGQKQRLNIARALLREPDVLILDESVNALDSETRLKVIRNIIKEYKDRIVIIVAHDKDIIEMMDEVIDLDQLKSESKMKIN